MRIETTYFLFEVFKISNNLFDFYNCEVVSSSDIRKSKAENFDRFSSIMAVVLKL